MSTQPKAITLAQGLVHRNRLIRESTCIDAADELRRLEHNNEVLMNALWKACGDDQEVVNATIESQGELK